MNDQAITWIRCKLDVVLCSITERILVCRVAMEFIVNLQEMQLSYKSINPVQLYSTESMIIALAS